MMGKLWTKVGVVLVGGFLLGSGLMLAAQPVQAHTSSERLPTPSCSGLPATAFFDVTALITDDTALANTEAEAATKQGGSVTGRGDSKYRYARITVPALAAGELRVFDANTEGPSDAVLCRGSTQVARSITSYSAHNNAHSAAAAATRAASAATTAHDKDDATDSDGAGTADVVPDRTSFSAVTAALSRVRSALSAARGALGTAAGALNTAAAANPDSTDRGAIEVHANTARTAEQNALTAHNTAITGTIDTSTDPPTVTVTVGTGTNAVYPTGATNDQKLPIAVRALDNALTALTNARNALDDPNAVTGDVAAHLSTSGSLAHEGFQLRASVSPGDEEYILVVAPQNPSATTYPFNAQFHGAIADTTVKRNRSLSAGVTDTIAITITTPGLLTLETTGSTDTVGMLEDNNMADIAQAESGGSGDNFKIVVPVAAVAHTVMVEGQTTRTSGAYTLDMDFKVAMPLSDVTAVTIAPASSPWATDVAVADDTAVQIQRRAADGNVADEDYFLFTPANSGFLTVNANDDNTAAPDANTRGTLFGAMGQGPAMDQRAGQIATDDNSGPSGTHFNFAVPVEGSKAYLVKVEGTDGAYALEFTLTDAADVDDTAGPDTITLPHPSIMAALSTARERDRYLFNIEEPGTLYLHTTGPTDVVGFLYGPDGSPVDDDDNSGTGTNFRIAVNVAPGLYLLEVEGQTAQTTGPYTLVSSFVAGPGPEPPTEPTTPTDPDPEPETDATGFLGNPPHNSTRSGIGIISGWVCEASNVAVTISPVGQGGSPAQTFNIGYGADRPDTVGECDHRSPDTGFGMAFNFNRLLEGQYRITARADGQQIGASRLFTVIYLDPDDTFLEDLEREVEVTDFPTTGETTTLEWEESLQNFVITDVQ